MSKRVLVRMGVCFIVLIVVLAIMLNYRAGNELALARKAAQEKQLKDTVKHYARCLNWYVPGGSAETAAEEMLILGKALFEAGRNADAVIVLARMRSGLYGASSFYIPRKDLIEEAEPLLASLRAASALGSGATKSELDKKTRQYLELMQRPSRPGPVPAAAAAFGFVFWICAVLGFIFSFFSSASNRWRRSAPFILAWAAGFALWLWGLVWA